MRKIKVLSESTQSKIEFDSDATTLGELKGELREMGVSFDSDSVFKEGRSKTILATDDSILPCNIPWKGDVTNDLVFMITAPHKKITSGAVSRRIDLYNKVKELGLQDKIQKEEGKNFTQCSTALLDSYVDEAIRNSSKKKPAPAAHVAKEKPVRKAKTEDAPEAGMANLDALHDLLSEMVSKNVLSKDNADNIWNVANGKKALPVEKGETYEELEGLFGGWE